MAKGSEEYIRTISQVMVKNTFLKYTTFILGIVSLCLAGLLCLFAHKVQEVKPLPIYIDKMTGTTKPVDFASIDAAGEERISAEIIDFCTNYVTNLYTFNRYTIKSNLEPVFNQSADEVVEKITYMLGQNDRAKWVNSNSQGVCTITYTDIVTATPDIKVQVAFIRKILDEKGEVVSEEKMVAVMRMKVVSRTIQNSHGLWVIEYRESKLLEVEDEVE